VTADDDPRALAERLERLAATVAAGLAEGRDGPAGSVGSALDELEARVGRLLSAHAAAVAYNRRIDAQFSELVDMVTALAALDYDARVTTHDGNDDAVNALAIGLNMMAEELKHTTEQLIAVRDAAMAANRAKSAFLANMSHELRTPLNAIIGYSELLCEDFGEVVDPQILGDLGRITQSARHLLSLIQDTLDISKIEADKLHLELVPVALTELLADLSAALAPDAAKRANTLALRLALDPAPRLCDPTRLRQIVLNLLSNANKFTQGGTITLDVREVDGDWVAITVSDTGVGIPRERHERIFGAFEQGDETTARVHGGTGLGLTISRRLCRMMGGSLTLTSEVGVGSTFVAAIPLRRAPPA
jgi:signal transduction histidine kinase